MPASGSKQTARVQPKGSLRLHCARVEKNKCLTVQKKGRTSRRGKMSWETPQNQEKPQPQSTEGAQMQQKTPSQLREGAFYLNGSSELTAEVVEQDVL